MILAVASGKGGTGKTTVSVNLARAFCAEVQLLDCDVEEPNAHLFLKGVPGAEEEVSIPVPEVTGALCDACGACGAFCRFHAIVTFGAKPIVFPELCHGCGGCAKVCPRGAIKETGHRIGVVGDVRAGGITLIQGRLDVGAPMAPPLIRAVKARRKEGVPAILDAPPGTSCPVIATIGGADFVLLVTEPTPFGLNDLKMAVDMVRELGLPFGVAVNRAGAGDDRVHAYCRIEGIRILLEIPEDRAIAGSYSRGELIFDSLPRYRPLFTGLVRQLMEMEKRGGVMAKELTIVSGKGGTGKTSLTASLAVLSGRSVLADCDVDAPDLHLVLSPRVLSRREFRSGNLAVIHRDACTGCGICAEHCRFDAVRKQEGGNGSAAFSVDPVSCEGCGVCVRFCPERCIDFQERVCGEWMVSETRCSPMIHARLMVASGNSGKLVSTVRAEARRIAGESGRPLIIVDGPPGIGCPVIASVTGASMVLVVTEPTLSGEHDLSRVLALARHFDVPSAVCVNKWDLNGEMTERIEEAARYAGALIAGRIRYDRAFTEAQMLGRAVVETEAPCAEDIRGVWERLGL